MFFGCCKNTFGKSPLNEYEIIDGDDPSTSRKSAKYSTGRDSVDEEEERQHILHVKKGKDVLEDGAFPTPRPSLGTKVTTSEENFEHNLLYKKVLCHECINYAAIVSYPDGIVLESNFPLKKKAIKKLVPAILGDTKAIAEKGILLCNDLPVYMPAKIVNGEAIYATPVMSKEGDNVEGGCTIMLAQSHLLIVVYLCSRHFEEVTHICTQAISILKTRV